MSYKVKTYGKPIGNYGSIYVGIDQSYSGFAVTLLNDDCEYQTTVAKFDGSGVARLAEIKKYLIDRLRGEWEYAYEYVDVAMEGYAFGSQMANMLGELGGLVKLTVYENYGIAPLIVPPTSLKKYVTGKGTGVQKNQMLLNIYKKWGVEFMDDNAADSYALAKLVAGHHSTVYETDVYGKLISDGKYRA